MSSKTTTVYQKTMASLESRYRAVIKLEPSEPIDFVKMADWLIKDVRPSLLPDSWRHYRNAMCDRLNASDEGRPEVIASLKEAPPLNSKKMKSQLCSSTQRDKGVSKPDLELIKQWASNNGRSEYATPMVLWLMATLYTGLRPSEWFTANLIPSAQLPGGLALRCVNQKVKKNGEGLLNQKGAASGQTHLVERTIDLSHLSQGNIEIIESQLKLTRHLSSMDEYHPGFADKFYKNITNTIYNCTRRCLGTREKCPTIYSARHQFASNMKARYKSQGISLAKRKKMIAVLMGQGSVQTSEYNYGLTYRGDPSEDMPFPLSAEYETAIGHQSHIDD